MIETVSKRIWLLTKISSRCLIWRNGAKSADSGIWTLVGLTPNIRPHWSAQKIKGILLVVQNSHRVPYQPWIYPPEPSRKHLSTVAGLLAVLMSWDGNKPSRAVLIRSMANPTILLFTVFEQQHNLVSRMLNPSSRFAVRSQAVSLQQAT